MCIHIQPKSYKTYRFPGSNNCIYFFVTGNAKPITASSEFATEGSSYTPSTPSTVSFTSESSLASNSGNISHKDYTPVLLIDKFFLMMLSDFYIPNFYSTIQCLALKCYNGTIGDLELVECPTEAIDGLELDMCMNISSEKGNAYSCSNKAALEADIKTQMRDNQCWRGNVTYLGMTELCICDTDGCNYDAGTHGLPHESAGKPVISANPFIVYVASRNSVDNQAN